MFNVRSLTKVEELEALHAEADTAIGDENKCTPNANAQPTLETLLRWSAGKLEVVAAYDDDGHLAEYVVADPDSGQIHWLVLIHLDKRGGESHWAIVKHCQENYGDCWGPVHNAQIRAIFKDIAGDKYIEESNDVIRAKPLEPRD